MLMQLKVEVKISWWAKFVLAIAKSPLVPITMSVRNRMAEFAIEKGVSYVTRKGSK